MFRLSNIRVYSLSLLGFGLTQCVTTGTDFPAKVDWIGQNTTTQDDVALVLGSPFAVGNSGGADTWTYGFYKYQLFGKGSHKELKIYWNSDKTVKHFTMTSSFAGDIDEAQHAAPASKSALKKSSPKY